MIHTISVCTHLLPLCVDLITMIVKTLQCFASHAVILLYFRLNLTLDDFMMHRGLLFRTMQKRKCTVYYELLCNKR